VRCKLRLRKRWGRPLGYTTLVCGRSGLPGDRVCDTLAYGCNQWRGGKPAAFASPGRLS
jgi:hypothetical protein